MKKFIVELRRTVVEAISIEVEAASEELAKKRALKQFEEGSANDVSWDLEEDETEVTGVYIYDPLEGGDPPPGSDSSPEE